MLSRALKIPLSQLPRSRPLFSLSSRRQLSSNTGSQRDSDSSLRLSSLKEVLIPVGHPAHEYLLNLLSHTPADPAPRQLSSFEPHILLRLDEEIEQRAKDKAAAEQRTLALEKVVAENKVANEQRILTLEGVVAKGVEDKLVWDEELASVKRVLMGSKLVIARKLLLLNFEQSYRFREGVLKEYQIHHPLATINTIPIRLISFEAFQSHQLQNARSSPPPTARPFFNDPQKVVLFPLGPPEIQASRQASIFISAGKVVRSLFLQD